MIGPREITYYEPLVLYGRGNLGKLAIEVFKQLKIPIAAIIEKDWSVPDRVKKNALLAICVATEPYKHVIQPLLADGWEDVIPVYDIFEAYPECGIHNGWFAGELTEEDKDNMCVVQEAFEDTASISHYLSFVIWHAYRECFPVASPIIVENRWRIPEVLALLHDHEMIYGEWPGSDLRSIWARRGIPSLDAGGKWTYIQLHLEGYELGALEHNLPVIQRDRPILGVTCYHSRDGLWKIPKFLIDNLPDYRFLFRLHAYMGQGAVLYCIPNERGY